MIAPKSNGREETAHTMTRVIKMSFMNCPTRLPPDMRSGLFKEHGITTKGFIDKESTSPYLAAFEALEHLDTCRTYVADFHKEPTRKTVFPFLQHIVMSWKGGWPPPNFGQEIQDGPVPRENVWMPYPPPLLPKSAHEFK